MTLQWTSKGHLRQFDTHPGHPDGAISPKFAIIGHPDGRKPLDASRWDSGISDIFFFSGHIIGEDLVRVLVKFSPIIAGALAMGH